MAHAGHFVLYPAPTLNVNLNVFCSPCLCHNLLQYQSLLNPSPSLSICVSMNLDQINVDPISICFTRLPRLQVQVEPEKKRRHRRRTSTVPLKGKGSHGVDTSTLVEPLGLPEGEHGEEGHPGGDAESDFDAVLGPGGDG